MLNSIDLNDKTYEELLTEAIAQIPLYSREWTNYNPSDPGITMLQNLTAFQLLQQEAINEVSEEIRCKLLKLVGYSPRLNRPATVLVQAPAEGGGILNAGFRLWSGEMSFELLQMQPLQPWGLEAVYAENHGKYRDLTRLLEYSNDSMAFPFGRRAASGETLVCVLSGTPEVGEPIRLWVQVAEEELRTPFRKESEIPDFSRVRWQYYTAQGWQDARFTDETIGMLRSGAVTLWLENGFPTAQNEAPAEGCALRCVLERADFDRTPRLRSMSVHLFPMEQVLTRVQCITCAGGQRVSVHHSLLEQDQFLVFCREKEDGPYRLYREDPGTGRQGRFFCRENRQTGVLLRFEGGVEPCCSPDAVRVVCYDGDMIHHRLLGPVRGYDRQVIGLDLVKNVLPDRFLLAVEVTDESGMSGYTFVAPGEMGPDGFRYHLRSDRGQIVIDEPGRGGYELLLAGCVTTEGSMGNLRPGARLEQRGGYDGSEIEQQFFCPAPGRFGVSQESAEDLRVRFSNGMHRTSVAVKTEDYEHLVHQTPGLCIHKVRAIAFGAENLIRIVVKPHTEEELPRLSDEYLRQIRDYLEPRRMLTTRFEICQPRYVPVGVSVTLSIRGMASYAEEETRRLLREQLDYVNGPQNFGGWIRFHEIYQKLNALPFVDAVDALTLFPESRDGVAVGGDIRLEDDSLCYPGTIQLTLREHGR